ncbi:MAG TPA: outer membrane lipoprotein carrier protein LolA [Bacteroidia bacterium]
MKNSIKAIVVLLATSLSVFAQDQDPKAKAILDDVSKTTKAYKTITTEYSLSVKNKDNKETDKQSGKVQVKGNKFRLELKGNTIVCDGKTVWTINHDAKEVSVKNYEPAGDDGLDPTKIFTMYEKGYKYKYDKEEKIGTTSVSVINLYPSVKPEKKKFHTVKLSVDKMKKQVKQLKMLMKDGGSQTYEVKSMTPNTDLADSLFVVDPKALGYEVIDER